MEPLPFSNRTAIRIRNIRKVRRITAEQLANGLTKNGYPVTRSILANYENARFKTLPVDLVAAAMRFYGVTFDRLLNGPLCNGCDDAPPQTFICKVCLRTTDANGNLIQC